MFAIIRRVSGKTSSPGGFIWSRFIISQCGSSESQASPAPTPTTSFFHLQICIEFFDDYTMGCVTKVLKDSTFWSQGNTMRIWWNSRFSPEEKKGTCESLHLRLISGGSSPTPPRSSMDPRLRISVWKRGLEDSHIRDLVLLTMSKAIWDRNTYLHCKGSINYY